MNLKKMLVVFFLLMFGGLFLTNCSTPPATAPAAPTATPTPPKAPVGTIQASNINGPMIFGDTSYGTNDFSSNISGNGIISPEDVWVIDVPSVPKTLTFSTCNVTTTWNDELYLRNTAGTEVAANNNSCTNQTILNYAVTIAGRYYLFVDGIGGAYGSYGVSITSP